MTPFSLNQDFDELVKVTLAEKQQILDNSNNNRNSSKENEDKPDMTDGSAKNPDFFQDNKPLNERSERKYTTTRIKLRNFLSNIPNVGINKEDFYNDNFIFDVYLLMNKNLNPFSLDRKLNDPNKHEMILYGKSACLCDFINLYAKRKISFTSTERMFYNQKYPK